MDKYNNKSKSKFATNKSKQKNKQDSKTIITSGKSVSKDISNDTMTTEEENEYKNKIAKLQKDLENEREKAQIKQNDPNIITNLKNEINKKNKEIKKYATINTKQRDQLEKLSQEIDDKLNKMNYKAVTRNIQNENKKINETKIKKNYSEQKMIENNISAKEKQLKNIMTLIDILQKENEKLKIKIENAKNTEQKFKLIDGQKEQEKQLNILNNDIKQKKLELKEHSKCFAIKNELLRKISLIKDEITINHEKLTEVQKKYEDLENKYKEQQNKSITTSSKENKFGSKSKTKLQRYIVPKQKPTNVLSDDDMVTVPPKISEIFTEKELKAMLIALDKNKVKYEALLRRFNVQNTYIDSLETKHKLDIKQKLNKINELDEQIEFMNVKKGEYNANIQLFKKQISEAQEEKKIYKMKINKMIEDISKKNKINSRKDREIKLLGAQLVKFKKYLKSGNLEKIQNEPDIEILGDQDTSELSDQNDGDTELTEKTGFYDNNDNNIKNVKLNKNNKNNVGTGDEIENVDQNVGSENEEMGNNEQEKKSFNEENDGDNIVGINKENNEGSNTGDANSSISHEDND